MIPEGSCGAYWLKKVAGNATSSHSKRRRCNNGRRMMRTWRLMGRASRGAALGAPFSAPYFRGDISCTQISTARDRPHAGGNETLLMTLGWLISSLVSACILVPHLPSVTIQQEPISEAAAPPVLRKAESSAWLVKIGTDLRRAEPRIVLIDGAGVLDSPREFTSLPNVAAALSRLATAAAPPVLLGLTDVGINDDPPVGFEFPLLLAFKKFGKSRQKFLS
jgi:hypothetical protein